MQSPCKIRQTKSRDQVVSGVRLVISRRLDVGECCNEIAQNFSGHHDGVAIAGNIFGDFHDHAAGVPLEIEKKHFAVGEDFFGVQ